MNLKGCQIDLYLILRSKRSCGLFVPVSLSADRKCKVKKLDMHCIASRKVTKYNLVTRRHIKMSRQGAGAVTMAVTKADPSPATALSLPRISPF